MDRLFANNEWHTAHTCLSGESFWMPDSVRTDYWAADFWDLAQAIEYTGGFPCE